ncbi:putative GTPase activating protein for Arf [Aspergillus stella-maris]|uniref:putative GTPase activating protein for Arf n=1 Tax=Aspergillus stella-maris TaxID=1810926 RepID=UPI003CCD104A
MVAGISKRQQQRNERTLQDLIRSVPGNDRCADCSAMNPGWASWNIGVFLCMRCAALHRKMGTHISKVKSLSMDTWTTEHVDNMRTHGNTIGNKIYNPRNVQPPVPTDIDESDACMERFIRQKYQTRSLETGKPKPPSRQDSSYTARSPEPDDEGSPPPLPPKPSRPFGFGLRSASSATNLNRYSTASRGPESPVTPVSDSRRSSFDQKLAKLRELGFTNERRNATALKGLDGNFDKTVETLVRLGEGRQTPQLRTPAATTPSIGASVSANPFDQLDAKQPEQHLQTNGQSYNPFDMPASQPQVQPQPAATQQLEQSFQNLQVTQPLFPHSTGGYPNTQNPAPQGYPPFAPAQPGFVSSPQPLDNGNNPFFQTGAQPQASLNNTPQNPYSANPFFTQAPTQQPQAPFQNQNQATGSPFPASLRHANTMPPLSGNSPFGQPSPFQSQPPPQPQQQQLSLQAAQAAQPGQSPFNPFQSLSATNTPATGYPNQSPFGYPQSAQPLGSQPTGRVDKNSILALYSFSAPPPAIPEQPAQPMQPSAPFGTSLPGQAQNPQPTTYAPTNYNSQLQPQPQPQPTVDPTVGSRNPFMGFAAQGAQQQPHMGTQPSAYVVPMNSANLATNPGFMRSHMSQQSVDINGFQTGRHSPDAFASLSARQR